MHPARGTGWGSRGPRGTPSRAARPAGGRQRGEELALGPGGPESPGAGETMVPIHGAREPQPPPPPGGPGSSQTLRWPPRRLPRAAGGLGSGDAGAGTRQRGATQGGRRAVLVEGLSLSCFPLGLYPPGGRGGRGHLRSTHTCWSSPHTNTSAPSSHSPGLIRATGLSIWSSPDGHRQDDEPQPRSFPISLSLFPPLQTGFPKCTLASAPRPERPRRWARTVHGAWHTAGSRRTGARSRLRRSPRGGGCLPGVPRSRRRLRAVRPVCVFREARQESEAPRAPRGLRACQDPTAST